MTAEYNNVFNKKDLSLFNSKRCSVARRLIQPTQKKLSFGIKYLLLKFENHRLDIANNGHTLQLGIGHSYLIKILPPGPGLEIGHF